MRRNANPKHFNESYKKKGLIVKTNKQVRNILFLNAVLLIAVVILFLITVLHFKSIQGAYDSISENSFRITSLETHLRSRGLVDGELDNPDVKPYSTEEMEDFQKWYDEQQQNSGES